MKNILEVNNLNVSFSGTSDTRQVVSEVTFSLGSGEILGLVGESGCGKSMTALSILKLLPETARLKSEHILFHNINLDSTSEKELRNIRGKDISMIFQEPMTSLNPLMKVGLQIAESAKLHMKLSKEEAQQKALEMMQEVGLSNVEVLYHRLPHQLSGGMQQRIMIALAMICNPRILIADEPTTALDVTIQAQILQLMEKLNKKHGTSIILISHDLGVISQMCQSVIVMYLGHIVEQGKVETVLSHPAHPYTNGLIQCLPDPIHRVEKLYTIPGHVPSLSNSLVGCPFEPRCNRSSEICQRTKPDLVKLDGSHLVRCYHPVTMDGQGGIG